MPVEVVTISPAHCGEGKPFLAQRPDFVDDGYDPLESPKDAASGAGLADDCGIDPCEPTTLGNAAALDESGIDLSDKDSDEEGGANESKFQKAWFLSLLRPMFERIAMVLLESCHDAVTV